MKAHASTLPCREKKGRWKKRLFKASFYSQNPRERRGGREKGRPRSLTTLRSTWERESRRGGKRKGGELLYRCFGLPSPFGKRRGKKGERGACTALPAILGRESAKKVATAASLRQGAREKRKAKARRPSRRGGKGQRARRPSASPRSHRGKEEKGGEKSIPRGNGKGGGKNIANL